MNRKLIKRFLAAGLALMGLLAGHAVYAQATSATVTVSAVVPKVCRFWSSPAAMLIQHGGGVIDPLDPGNATGSSTINYRCQTGVSPEFDIGNPTTLSGTYASPKTRVVPLAGASTNLNASITVTATGGAGSGLGTDKTATIDGFIAPADFSTALADTYSATVTIAIQAVP
jgi:hypothetical protein